MGSHRRRACSQKKNNQKTARYVPLEQLTPLSGSRFYCVSWISTAPLVIITSITNSPKPQKRPFTVTFKSQGGAQLYNMTLIATTAIIITTTTTAATTITSSTTTNATTTTRLFVCVLGARERATARGSRSTPKIIGEDEL